MKVFLLFLLLVALSRQQEWTQSTLFQSAIDFSVTSDGNRTLLVFTTSGGLYYSMTPFDMSVEISNRSGTHPIVKVLNGTWILALIQNVSIIILRTTNQDFGVWNLVLELPASNSIVTLDHGGSDFTAFWADPNGTMKLSRSYDDGINWVTVPAFSFSNFSAPFLTAVDQYYYLLTFAMDGFEVLFQGIDRAIIYNTTGSGRPQVAADYQTTLFLSGSGDLVISRDGRTTSPNWTAPMRIAPGSITTDGNGTWLILTLNLSIFRSIDNAQTWIREDIGSGLADKIEGSPDQIFFLQNNTIFSLSPPVPSSPSSVPSSPSSVPSSPSSVPSSPSSPVPSTQVVLLNESLLITMPLLLNRSLLVEGTLSLGSSLQIIGNLTLTSDSTLDLTNRTALIEVTGIFTAGGRLVLPEGRGTLVLIKFNSSQGNFSQIDGPECSRIEYAQSQLLVVFGSNCTEPAIQLWMIILIVVASVVAVAIAVVLFVFFRKKIAPYHDRTYHVPASKALVA